jgi:hypothetical protein
MARTTTLTEEVQVLRFFETGPIDKVEAVFNIVSEKMRERLNAPETHTASPAKGIVSGRKRLGRGNAEASVQDGHPDSQPVI